MISTTLERLRAVGRMHQIGLVNLLRPDRLVRAAVNNARLGPQAALIMKAAVEHPDAPAVTDERGTLSDVLHVRPATYEVPLTAEARPAVALVPRDPSAPVLLLVRPAGLFGERAIERV